MGQPGSNTVVVACVREDEEGVPTAIKEWLSKRPWRRRVFALTDRGFYHGDLTNQMPAGDGAWNWWTFEGITKYLVAGELPKTQQAVAAG